MVDLPHDVLTFATSPATVSGLFGFAGAAGALALRRLFGPERAPSGALRAGPVSADFHVEGYRLHPRNIAARRWVGNRSLSAELDRLSIWFPADADALAAHVVRLEAEGRPFRQLADHVNGKAYELTGAPVGGQAALNIVEASDANRALAAARRDLAALREENAALRETLDSAPLLAWRRDAEGALTWGNLSYLALSGSDGADGPPQELRGGAPVGEADGLPARPGEAARPRKSGGRQCFFDAHTGERRWYEVRHSTAEDGGEIGYATDAAPIIQAEATLRRFVETLTETFAHLKIGLAIFDREHRLGLFNPAFSELMRLDPAWLAARPRLKEVLGRLRDSQMLPEQDDYRAWRKRLLDLFDEPEAADFEDLWRLPGDVAIRVLARPHPQGALAFLFEDVSETLSLEARVHTEVRMRRATMDRLTEGIAVFGPDGLTRFANPAFANIWGFDPISEDGPARARDVIGHCAERTEDGEEWARLADFVAGGDTRAAWSARFQLSDGRALRGRFAPLPDGSTLTAFLDVTDAEKAAKVLRERNAALVVAHEMRNELIEQIAAGVRAPLTRVVEHSRALSENRHGFLDERQQRHADAAATAAMELVEALRGGASLASAQADAIAPVVDGEGPVDLRRALEAVLTHIRRSFEAHGATLDLDFPESLGSVVGDVARVRQILFNLITDAARRCSAGDIVSAGAARRGDMVEIWTREAYPPGVPAPELDGLAHGLVKRFAEMHKGWVSVAVAPPEEDGAPAGLVVTCALPATIRSDAAVA